MRGRKQAESLRPKLREEEFTGVHSSDLLRCRTTAELAWGEAEPDQRLRELNFGIFEEKAFLDVDPEVFEQVSDFKDFEIPGGESLAEFRLRIREAVEEMAPGRHLCFVHGGVIRALCQEAGLDRFVPTGTLVGLDWNDQRILFVDEGSEAI